VRVVAATHQPLEALVAQGRFRADLLHRLDVVRLQLPPLRERREDIPLLAQRFLAAAARRLQLPPKRLSQEALARLQAHAWPGNVRELENLCWRFAALAPGEVIVPADLAGALPVATAGGSDGSDDGADWKQALAAWTRRKLEAGAPEVHAEARQALDAVVLGVAMEHTGGQRGDAAVVLGLGRNTVTRKLGPSRRRR
jgi:two-component system nitrogen regulation response regulator GlnG